LRIEIKKARSGYDRKTCFVHARAAAIPGDPPTVVMTMHPLRLTGTDVFYAVHEIRTDDGGKTWSEPIAHEKTLGRRPMENDQEEEIIDLYPKWHEKTGVVLGVGSSVLYTGDVLLPHPRLVKPGYTVYDAEAHAWTPWKKLDLPDAEKFYETHCGSAQRFDLPNGDILLPIAFGLSDTAGYLGHDQMQEVSAVARCAFDGENLKYIEHGAELTLREGGGLCEPSLAFVNGRHFLTLRNNETGYVTASDDGLHYDTPVPWTFDDGSNLGNYFTQQHWVSHGDELYLVYTRRGAKNDHIFRHRAPLFIGQVDTERLCVIRETERILVPERGARLGNFGVTEISDNEVWVVVAEWMQCKLPDHWNPMNCERYGSDNTIFVAKLFFEE